MTQSSDSLDKGLGQLTRLVRRFGRFRKRWSVIDGLALFVLIGPGSLLAWFLVDWVVRLPAWPLFLFFVAVCVAALWAALRWLLRPQLYQVDTEHEAVVIEQLHGELDNRLIGSLQLGSEVQDADADAARLGYSPALVDELVRRTTDGVRELRPERLVDRTRTRKRLLAALGVVVVCAAACVFAADAIRDRYERLLDAYATVIETIFPVTIEVQPGDIAVLRGSQLALQVHVDGARRKIVDLTMIDDETGEESVQTLALADRRAEFTVAAAQQDFRYRFTYGGRKSDSYLVRVADRPEIKAINYEMTPPEYTGQPMRLTTGRIPALKALPGTAVLVSFAASTRLHPDLCHVEWLNGDRQRIDVSGRFGNFSFSVMTPERVSVYLTGEYGEGFEMEEPLTFQVVPLRDEPPDIQLLTRLQASEVEIGTANSIYLKWFARDDFGIQKAGFEFEVETISDVWDRGKRKGSREREYDPPRDRVKGGFRNVFKDMNPRLAPGDKVKLSVYAMDNNTETGPGRAESKAIEMVVVNRPWSDWADDGTGGFGGRERESMFELIGSERVPREQELLQPTVRIVSTEKPFEIKRLAVEPGGNQEMEPVAGGDPVADYFNLISGTDREDEQ